MGNWKDHDERFDEAAVAEVKKVGNIILLGRRALRISQTELGKRAGGLTPWTVSAAECGKPGVGLITYLALLMALGKKVVVEDIQ